MRSATAWLSSSRGAASKCSSTSSPAASPSATAVRSQRPPTNKLNAVTCSAHCTSEPKTAMKKTVLALAIALAATTASAELLEAVVVRVGDRIITRTQYDRRLQEKMAEIDQSAEPSAAASLKQQASKELVNELISELLIKDRADRLGISVSDAEMKDAINHLKQQYNIQTDQQFEASLKQSGMTRADMEARLRETFATQKAFSPHMRNRADLTDPE